MPRLRVPVLLLCLALVACGASQRERTIKGALVAVNAARDGFLAFDAEKQAAIVASAPSLEAGHQALADYRTARAKVETAFVAAYRAISLAATLKDEPLAHLSSAAEQLRTALHDLTGGTP